MHISRGLSAKEQQALKNVSNGNRASLCNTKEAQKNKIFKTKM
jgi:hypothetical protein